MPQTIEAEVDVDGSVRLLETVRVTKRTRALVTLLEDEEQVGTHAGNGAEILKLLRSPEFVNRKSYPAEEIEAQIQAARDSWE